MNIECQRVGEGEGRRLNTKFRELFVETNVDIKI